MHTRGAGRERPSEIVADDLPTAPARVWSEPALAGCNVPIATRRATEGCRVHSRHREKKINTESFIPSREAFQALEHSRLQALVTRDMPLARRLHAPDFHLVTPSGGCYSREEYLGHVESGRLHYRKWEVGDMIVRVFPEVAILRDRAELEMGADPEEAHSFSCWHTDSYEMRGKVWQVVLSQATRVR